MEATTAHLKEFLPFIYVPASIIKEINQAINASEKTFGSSNLEHIFYLPISNCSKEGILSLPTITLSIGGRDFDFEGKDYAYKSGQNCQSAFRSLIVPESSNWELGNPFMRKYYTVFDLGNASRNPRVGFANSI